MGKLLSVSQLGLLVAVAALLTAGAAPVLAQEGEQSRESMALDNTAAQWSFQFAYQANTDYRRDTLANGFIRPEGNKGFVQFRMVAPIPVKGGAARGGVTILPRLTVRYTETANGEWPSRRPICLR